MLYFAYGSNMNHEQMKKRCPLSKFICNGKLDNHGIVFDGYSKKWGGSVANVIPSEGVDVEGGVFEITNDDLNSLDKCEGYPVSYDRREVIIKAENGVNINNVVVYFREGEKEGIPSNEYLNVIKRGARDCGILNN